MRQDTEKCLEKFRVITFGNKKTINALDSLIPENEVVHYIAPATVNFFVPNQTVKLQSVGAIAFTDKNLFVQNMLNLVEPQVYPLDQVIDVNYNATGLVASNFTMIFDEVTLKFYGCTNRTLAAEMYSKIKELISQQTK